MNYDRDGLYSVKIRDDLIDKILEEIKDGTRLAPKLQVKGATDTEVAAHLRYMYKDGIIERGVDKDPFDVPYTLNLSAKGERRTSNLQVNTPDVEVSVTNESSEGETLSASILRGLGEKIGHYAAWIVSLLTLAVILLVLQFGFGIPLFESVFGI